MSELWLVEREVLYNWECLPMSSRMRCRCRFAVVCFLGTFWVLGTAGALGAADAGFDYKLRLSSTDFPSLDADGKISGSVAGETKQFVGEMVLATSGLTTEEGPQGWSCGVRHEGVELLSITREGTVSADASAGGLVDNGFVVYEAIDPAKNEGKTGVTQAVVLSLTLPVTLPPNVESVIGKNTYQATIPSPPATQATGFVRFEEGLRGKGQPVANNVTYLGKTKIPSLGSKDLTIERLVAKETNCTNGVDDDGDQLADCDDPDCAEDPACKGGGLVLEADTAGSTRVGDVNEKEIGSAPVAGTPIEGTFLITPVGDPLVEGAQGWSISVEHQCKALDILSEGGFPTIDGTDAGALWSGGFKQTQIVDPARNEGRCGFVSAVVLSLTEPIQLDKTKRQSIARSKYAVAAAAEAGDFPTLIEYKDGLRGLGQPVSNVITVKGATIFAAGYRNLRLKLGAVVEEQTFIRGDPNDDGKSNIADPIWIVNELVRQGPKTACQDAADANDDGLVDLSDAMYLIQWRFMAGPQPTAPFPACGKDVAGDSLSCPKGSVKACP
ncbi:MAG: hypothetical protein ACUVYA_10490 [Planctomycetota bacterium]